MTWETLVNNTVGYNECEDKEAFMLGAHIMHTKLSVQIRHEIDGLNQMVEYYKNIAERKQDEIATIARILKNASEE